MKSTIDSLAQYTDELNRTVANDINPAHLVFEGLYNGLWWKLWDDIGCEPLYGSITRTIIFEIFNYDQK